MKKKAWIWVVVAAIAAIITGFVLGYRAHGYVCPAERVETRIDTIPYYKPVAKDSVIVRYVTERLPAASKGKTDEAAADGEVVTATVTEVSGDSATVVIPIEQKVYEGEDYKAWVSGYRASLDSINVYRTTETIRIKERAKRWHIGLTAGYGYGVGKGMVPYIGIGITWSIISF